MNECVDDSDQILACYGVPVDLRIVDARSGPAIAAAADQAVDHHPIAAVAISDNHTGLEIVERNRSHDDSCVLPVDREHRNAGTATKQSALLLRGQKPRGAVRVRRQNVRDRSGRLFSRHTAAHDQSQAPEE